MKNILSQVESTNCVMTGTTFGTNQLVCKLWNITTKHCLIRAAADYTQESKNSTEVQKWGIQAERLCEIFLLRVYGTAARWRFPKRDCCLVIYFIYT